MTECSKALHCFLIRTSSADLSQRDFSLDLAHAFQIENDFFLLSRTIEFEYKHMARHLLFKAKMDILFDGKLDEYSSSKKSSFLFSVVNDSQLFCPGDWIGQGKKVGCDRQANSSRNVNRGAKSSTSFSGIIFSYFGTGFELRLNASNQFDSD